MVHGALLLMLGARTTVTPFHHQPEAQHPKIFQLSTSCRPITPSFGTKRTSALGQKQTFGSRNAMSALPPIADIDRARRDVRWRSRIDAPLLLNLLYPEMALVPV